jgi:type IV conjugative transfer system protein TraL
VEPLNNHIILSHIDTPLRILFWPANQFFACVTPLALGIMMLVAGAFSRAFKKRFGRGKFRSVMYWLFPTPMRIVRLGVPPSHVRYWVK